MRGRSRDGGFSLLEVMATAAIMAVLLTLAVTRWQGYTGLQRLRYGTAQVATDLRAAQERAKAERAQYTVTFTASSAAYAIARTGGGFLENARLPDGVTAVANDVVIFSAFGRPDRAHTITVQNSMGTGQASVNAGGGITYQEP